MSALKFDPIPEGKVPLYEKYAGQIREQDAYLDLDEDGTVSVGTSGEIGNAIPMSVWNRRTIRWKLPGTAMRRAIEELLRDIAPLLERVHAGHDVDWDGSRNKGTLTEDAAEAEQAIEDHIDRTFYGFAETRAAVWDIGDWLCPHGTDQDNADTLGIAADSTDEAISERARELVAEAEADDVILDGNARDVADYLRDLRGRLRDRAQEDD